MRVHISVDMEGIAGICHEAQADTGGMDFQRMREFMTSEVQAAVEGAKAGGATDILVCDAHDTSRNLIVEDLDPNVVVIQGAPYDLGMMAGISDEFDASMLVGYHAKRDSPSGVIGHTYSYDIAELKLNGVVIGETGLSAAIAGHFGVPVVMVAGEQLAVDEIKSLVPKAVGVATKKGVGLYAARSVSPERSRQMIRSGAEEAVRGCKGVAPYVVKNPIHMDVTFTRVVMAQFVSKVPGVTRTGQKTVSFDAGNVIEAFDVFEVMNMVADSAGSGGVL